MKEILTAISIIGFGVSIFVVAIVAAVKQAEYMSAVPMIERLRVDSLGIAPAASEDVLGQITAWNQTIATMQRWNRVPALCLFVPNGWDAVEYIPVPKEAP
jgi:hypothetical protein